MNDAHLVKRSITLDRHRTSLALEPEFWTAIEAVAQTRSMSLSSLLAEIDRDRAERPLASACRVFALRQHVKSTSEL
jgi:predicted DNA-binding ribbon-helix-helix protein